MRWMRRWLLDKNDSPLESDFPIASDRDLQCTETGQVLSTFHGKSVFQFNAERARELQRNREEMYKNRTPDTFKVGVARQIGVGKPIEFLVSGQSNGLRRERYSIDRWAVTTEPGITIPVRLFRPDPPASSTKPLVVYVGADLKIAAPGGPIEARVKAGESVAMIEPRGVGETAPVPPSRGEYGKGMFGTDEREAALSLHLNRPLLGQRVFDVLQGLRAIVPTDGPKVRTRHRVRAVHPGGN